MAREQFAQTFNKRKENPYSYDTNEMPEKWYPIFGVFQDLLHLSYYDLTQIVKYGDKTIKALKEEKNFSVLPILQNAHKYLICGKDEDLFQQVDMTVDEVCRDIIAQYYILHDSFDITKAEKVFGDFMQDLREVSTALITKKVTEETESSEDRKARLLAEQKEVELEVDDQEVDASLDDEDDEETEEESEEETTEQAEVAVKPVTPKKEYVRDPSKSGKFFVCYGNGWHEMKDTETERGAKIAAARIANSHGSGCALAKEIAGEMVPYLVREDFEGKWESIDADDLDFFVAGKALFGKGSSTWHANEVTETETRESRSGE